MSQLILSKRPPNRQKEWLFSGITTSFFGRPNGPSGLFDDLPRNQEKQDRDLRINKFEDMRFMLSNHKIQTLERIQSLSEKIWSTIEIRNQYALC